MIIDIAEQGNEKCVALKDVSERQKISTKYLEQIVTHLTKTGLLRSVRGAQGGYVLTKAPEDYSVGEILRAIEGNFAPVACLESNFNSCDRQHSCRTLRFWKGLHETINDYIDSTKLSDLMPKK
jgi:Rrf2 family protein